MKRIIFTFLPVLLLNAAVLSQDLPYAKQIVQTLASQEYGGRGYSDKSDRKAAEFIAKEFEKLGVKPLVGNYFQDFTISVNTFPKDIFFEVNGKEFRLGIDYMINPGAPPAKGTYETVTVTRKDMLDKDKFIEQLAAAKGKVMVIKNFPDTSETREEKKAIGEILSLVRYAQDNPAEGTIILTKERIKGGILPVTLTTPTFTINVDSANITEINKVKFKIKSKFLEDYKTQNVVGMLEGKTQPDSFIVLTGHYDHLGKIGKQVYFPGANDNASGIAMILNMAEYYSKNPPDYSMVFIALSGEEIGLKGAEYFAENPLIELDKIKFLVNFDLAGTGDDGIKVVNGTIFKEEFALLQKINEDNKYLPKISKRGEACISDHCMFYRKDVPCFFIYTLGGIDAYHDIYDRYETLPFTEFQDYFRLMRDFFSEL